LIKESNNDAGLAAHPSRLFVTNQNHFQLAMLAYNLNAADIGIRAIMPSSRLCRVFSEQPWDRL
jgi:hypothetical protein